MKQDQLIDTDQKVACILKEMEQGFRVDVNMLLELKSSYKKTLLYLQKRIDESFGRTVEVNSNKNLGSVLFEHMLIGIYEKSCRARRQVADALARLWIDHLHHHADDVPWRAELSVAPRYV